jgi:hypothetical protein
MIKLIQCVHARSATPKAEFQRQWQEYGEQLRARATELGAVRIVLDTTLSIEVNQRLLQERGSMEPFDGVAEIWWDRGAELLEKADDKEMSSRIDRLREIQQSFMDVERSSFFFALETVVHAEGA